jgi:hypothetical protein
MAKRGRVRFNKVLNLGNGQCLDLSATSNRGYLTTFSRNVLKEAPVVIGPVDLTKEQWLELAGGCTKIAGLLSRSRKPERELY